MRPTIRAFYDNLRMSRMRPLQLLLYQIIGALSRTYPKGVFFNRMQLMQNQRILRGFVVIEGIDGAGTTTQLNSLGDRLLRENIRGWTTCEPTDGPVGGLIRRVLGAEVAVEPTTLAYLFVADRYQHVYAEKNGIVARTGDGVLVVCDRYIFSSLAYQSVDCGYDLIAGLNGEFPLPELLIYLDVTAEVGIHRAANRESREIFEHMAFQKKVVGFYERALKAYESSGMVIARIDGAQPPEVVAQKIWSHVDAIPIG